MKKILALFASLLTVASMMAQEAAVPEVETADAEAFSQWSVSLGVSYRKFHKVDFKHRSAGSFEDAVVVDGALLPNSQEAIDEAVAEHFGGVAPTAPAFFRGMNFASYTGINYKTDERVDTKSHFAPAIGAEANLWQDGDFELKMAVGLQYFNPSADDRKPGKGSLDLYSRPCAWTGTHGYPNYGKQEAATVSNVAVKSSGRAKFSADLYVLDLGLKGGWYLMDDLKLIFAFGPTFNLASMDSSNYSAISSDGLKLASTKITDDKTRFRFGYYVSGGAQYDFTENWALSAELRWDDAFGKLETRVAEQRLDTLGGTLKIVYNF